jgi:hypothetical protein
MVLLMVLAGWIATRWLVAGLLLAAVASALAAFRVWGSRRGEQLRRAIATVDLAWIERLLRSRPVHFEAVVALATLAGTKHVHALGEPAAECVCGGEGCEVARLDRELASLLLGIEFLERGDFTRAMAELESEAVDPVDRPLLDHTPIRQSLFVYAAGMSGRGKPARIAGMVESIDRLARSMPLLRWPLLVAAANLVHKGGDLEDVRRRLKRIPRLPEGSWLEAQRAELEAAVR